MPNLGTPEILIIAVVVVLLFGATKLPQMARSLGQSARVFKSEARGMKDDEAAAKKEQPDPQQLTSGEQNSAPFSQTSGEAQGQTSQQTSQQASQRPDSKN